MEIDEINYNSDEEVNNQQHARLLEDVLQLDRKQFVKKPSRTEPTLNVSEFNLIKSSYDRKNKLKVSALTKSLKNKEKHSTINKKLISATKRNKLHKPLEKPAAERFRRIVGFKKTSQALNKWNSIVESNKVASQLSFPLDQDEVYFQFNGEEENRRRYKTKLDLELEKHEEKGDTEEKEQTFSLSMDEIIERRKEIAKLRALQSYQEAKAFRKKKIKSKTYHRIQRKERLKLQIKEFELLKKIDPEEALRKLEQLEKTRIEERMSLRHRSTGQWAKNKQIRAKYDKESRQALAQQLSLSKELTQKIKMDDDSSESDVEEIPKNVSNTANPWVSENSNEYTEFVSNYRKYWNEKNNSKVTSASLDNNLSSTEEKEKSTVDQFEEPKQVKENKERKIKQNNKDKKSVNKTKKVDVVKYCNNTWTVTSHSENEDVEDMFDDLKYKAEIKVSEKLNKMKMSSNDQKKSNIVRKQKKEKNNNKLKLNTDLKRSRFVPEIDEELGNKSEESEDELNALKEIINSAETNVKETKEKHNVDPHKFLEVKSINLETKLPDVTLADDSEDEDQRAYISEAFADDDIAEEFNKEKDDIVESEKPKDIDLSLPGWGSWGGKSIALSKRKRNRFIIKMPKDVPRRDENKKNLIINEHKDTKIKKHQVSEVPFPFTTVKDFEASMRAPIGNTFIPETAFKTLIQPAVKTQKGSIIEPMSESVLLKQTFK